MKILIVDDDPIILELLEDALGVNGYTAITTAEDGDAAIAIVSETDEPFDAVLLDIQMPRKDGIEVCRHLRCLQNYRHVPILMVTAMHEKHYVERAFLAGASDYINKPFDAFEIGVRLRNALALREAQLAIQEPDIERHTHEAFSSDELMALNALENYAQQLERLTVQHTFIGFRIRNFASLKSRTSAERLDLLLHGFVSVVKRHFNDEQVLMSYAADGTFLCLIEGDNVCLDGFVRSTLQDMLNILPWRSGRSDISAELSMGDPVRCRKFHKMDARASIDACLESTCFDVSPKSPSGGPGLLPSGPLTASSGD